MTPAEHALISVKDLVVDYPARGGLLRPSRLVRAVDRVSFEIQKGETLGLVGESGCGKSTLGKALLRLVEPAEGRVSYDGQDLALLPGRAMRKRRKSLQMIFQDPYSSLNPRMTIGSIIGEPIRVFGLADRASIPSRVHELLKTVGLNRSHSDRYPREFSGGQLQRVGIARALAAEPEFIVADEPISALDVSIQAQILNLMERLRVEKNLTYLFVSHDLRAVRHLADRVAVMYLGRIVELGPSEEVYLNPLMPYTKALISSIPVADPELERRRERLTIRGDIPSAINPPSGCRFNTRCPFAIEECRSSEPRLVEVSEGHFAACIRIDRQNPDIDKNAANGLGTVGLSGA